MTEYPLTELMKFKTLEGYRLLLRENARQFWSGQGDWYDFYTSMMLSIERGFKQAWAEGMLTYGLKLDDQNAEEKKRLAVEINAEKTHIETLADYIEKNSKANGGKLTLVFQRVEQWISAYSRIRQLATAMAAKDKPLEWVYGPTEHCADCLRLNGRVYRASIWIKNNLLPKSWQLECHGIHCQCELKPTTKPLTRGRPPRLG
jgi:hypothetical protein